MGMEGIPKGIDNFEHPEKFSHLKEGVAPIIASVRDWITDFKSPERAQELKFIRRNFTRSKDALDVNWHAQEDELERNALLHAGRLTYVISPIDSRRKFSTKLFPCTSLVVVGKDKITGKNISFLTHQMAVLSPGEMNKFLDDLKKQLTEIGERCEPGTVDAVIAGGDFVKDRVFHKQSARLTIDEYIDVISLLGTEVAGVLKFEPIVVNGPSAKTKRDDVYFDTENRRLYFFREERNPEVGSFVPSQIKRTI